MNGTATFIMGGLFGTLAKQDCASDLYYGRGCLDKGLWAFSRHPDYFAEQAIRMCFYPFTIR